MSPLDSPMAALLWGLVMLVLLAGLAYTVAVGIQFIRRAIAPEQLAIEETPDAWQDAYDRGYVAGVAADKDYEAIAQQQLLIAVATRKASADSIDKASGRTLL